MYYCTVYHQSISLCIFALSLRLPKLNIAADWSDALQRRYLRPVPGGLLRRRHEPVRRLRPGRHHHRRRVYHLRHRVLWVHRRAARERHPSNTSTSVYTAYVK